mgnify:FL=1
MLNMIVTVLGILVLAVLWVALYDSNRFVLRKLEISDPRIRRQARAVVIADLHNKQYGRDNESLLCAIREQKPDFILIAGDILTASPGKTMKPALHFLRALAEEYPVYYGNGNHEHRLKLYPETYGGMAQEYAEGLREIGIEPLVNSHVSLAELGVTVYGAEIDRKYYRRFQIPDMEDDYLSKILGQADSSVYTVLLAHNPDYFPQYAGWGADLTVSGHVHGGVARVPLWGRGVISPGMLPFPKYDGGIFREGKAVMLLSRGLGMHTIPIRIFNPGELWVVDFSPLTDQKEK